MCSAELLDAFLTMWIQRIGERPRDPNNHLWDKIVLSRRQTARQQVIEESDVSLQQSYYEHKVPAKAEAETNLNNSGNDSSEDKESHERNDISYDSVNSKGGRKPAREQLEVRNLSSQVNGLEINLKQPKFFLERAGVVPQIPFDSWLKQIKIYLVATGLSRAEEERQVSVLVYLLGAEGQRVLDTLMGPKDTVDDISKLLSVHFNPSKTSQFWRTELLNGKQRPGESIQAYGLRLNDLISKCDYPQSITQTELLKDKFIAGLKDNQTRHKFILKTPKSFEDVQQFALQNAVEPARNFSQEDEIKVIKNPYKNKGKKFKMSEPL